MAATVKIAPQKNIQDTILTYKRSRPDASCEEITTFVKKHFPKCNTNPASVACTLSKAAKRLNEPKLHPGRLIKQDDELPTFKPAAVAHDEALDETEDQARERINIRYQAMERMAPRVIAGRIPSLIVSGPPGVGKSWTVTESLKESGRMRHDGLTNVGGGGPMRAEDEATGQLVETPGYYDQIQGTCTAVGLYHALWNMRNGGVLFLDDCDAVFRDEDALNLLKVATDSTRERLLSWRKHATWLDEYEIDKTFDFRGHIIFLTNIDFEEVIRRGHKDSEHFKALIDRAAYLCLTLRTARDFMIRIKDVAGGKHGFLARHPYDLQPDRVTELLDFVAENQNRFYNLSLRLVGQIALMMKADPRDWRRDVTATKMRTI